jgi:hypothetical protein
VYQRRMRAASIGLVALSMVSGSPAVGSQAVMPKVTRISGDDFSVQVRALSRSGYRTHRVVLARRGVQSRVHFSIVVNHPDSVDSIDALTVYFERGQGDGFKHFRMTGGEVTRLSSTSSELVGTASFVSRSHGERARVRPGGYRIAGTTMTVSEDGRSSTLDVTSATGRLWVLYRTKIFLTRDSASPRGVWLSGRLIQHTGAFGDRQDRWTPSQAQSVALHCTHPRKKWTPRIVKTVEITTDARGRFTTGLLSCDEGNRWRAAFHGSGRLYGSWSDSVRAHQ